MGILDKLKSIGDVSSDNGVNILVYGPSGVGKTYLARTIQADPGRVLYIGTERGSKPISDTGFKAVEVTTIDEVEAIATELETGGSKQFDWLIVDSVSALSASVLKAELKKHKNGMQAYGEMGRAILGFVDRIQALPGVSTYVTAEMDSSEDKTYGRTMYHPAAEGSKVQTRLPYILDYVLALRTKVEPDGTVVRKLQCHPDGVYIAKSRSHKLDRFEDADLGKLISKITTGE